MSVDELSELIRRVDGNHDLGAGVLAEVIVGSPWHATEIRRAKAAAWEEGACVGDAYGMTAISLNPLHANPYEEASS